ncbi:MAG: phage tail protein, partial [Zoogloea sp.]|nr:phage tail protein [Zoogloea sp.]
MPEYLAPGVFVEETSFRHKSIEGVGTSVAAIVGPTRSGPLRGIPEAITSYADFERVYGDAADLSFSDAAKAVPNYTAHAVRAFFDNGGKQIFVARVIQGVNTTDADGSKGSAGVAGKADATNAVSFASRFPGAMGNYTLELRWRAGENLLRTEQPNAAAAGHLYLLEAAGVVEAAVSTGTLASDKYPVDLKAIVKLDGTHYAMDGARAVITSMADPLHPAAVDADKIAQLDPSKLPAGAKLTRIFARQPVAGPLAAGTAAVLSLSAAT